MNKQNAVSDNEKKIKLTTLIYAILIIFIIIIGIGSILAYGTQTAIGEKIAAKMSKVIPFPAAIVGYTHVVYLDDMAKNLASVEKFYASQDFSKDGLRVDFTTPDGKKRLEIKEREILNKLVEDKVIEILAKKLGISISKKDVDTAIAQKLDEYGMADEIKNDLLNSYGWSMEDFKKQVVLQYIYKDFLTSYVAQHDSDSSIAKGKIEQAKKQLENGKDFAQVVRDYSEGQSKEKKGELGWVKKDQVASELQEALFGSRPYEKNSIIESSIGFHIIDIEEKKKEGSADVLKLRQIFVSKNTFAGWLEKQKKEMKIFVPLKEFTWNGTAGLVDFRDKKMQEFEREERSKAQGDASIMF